MINSDELDLKKPGSKPRDLEPMSMEELEDYIMLLEQEIMRVDAMISNKNAHRQGIDALFCGSKE